MRSHPYHRLIPSNRSAAWVSAGTDGKHIDARGITVDNRKRALLLHVAVPAIQDIFPILFDTHFTP